MPTIFAHAVAAAALAPAVRTPLPTWRILLAGSACAVAPDLDVIAFSLGIPYEHILGHRGLTHSLTFAGGLGALVVAVFFRRAERKLMLWVYFTAATASHGLLDMLTDGGHGVALFAPFYNARLFFPWRPVEVSPIGAARFFSERGVDVLASEALWIGLPALGIASMLWLARRRREAMKTEG